MNVIGLSPYHEKNLRTLAAYLLRMPPQTEGRSFDMDRFAADGRSYGFGYKQCGSVGCAVGHAPYAGIAKNMGEDWTEFSVRVFGLKGRKWLWCFCGDWRHSDNTPRGAAIRILWLLEKGLPRNSSRQMDGKHRLCYVDYKPAPEFVPDVEWTQPTVALESKPLHVEISRELMTEEQPA